VFKCGQTVLDTKAIGDTTKLAERESFGMLMVMSSKVSGKMTKQTDMASTFI